jgi:hypothetical protein
VPDIACVLLLRPRILGTTTFRLVLIYLALFTVSALSLLGFVYWSTASVTADQTDETIQAEITGLAEQYRLRGLPGLTQIVAERARNQRQSLYLLAAPDGRPLSGNLDSWPDAEAAESGWMDFQYRRPVGGEIALHNARARQFVLAGGFRLLVGRDVQERLDFVRRIQASLGWAVALIIGLGLIGGIVMSRNLLRRVDAINRTGREIMAGDLDRRIPLSGSGDEFDQLASNLNAMLDQIQRLVLSMRQVTENIAHDLRSPLNRLRTRLEVTLMEEGSPVAYRAALERSIEEADQLIATFNALLSIARIEGGAAPGTGETVDLSALVRDAVEFYQPVAESHGQTLATDVEPGLIAAANRQLLNQAVANLIDNSIKYGNDSGHVVVSARRHGNDTEIVIADDGPGIPEADRERVQGRFVRLEASRNRPGSGLGLSLVRAVAGLHGGELKFEDNAPGLRAVIRIPNREAVPAAL